MNESRIIPLRRAGFTMIEVLIALVIIALGLLGLAGLQVRMQQAEFDSYQRSQALVLLYDMVDRINIHRETAACFRVTTNTTAGTPYLGTGSAAVPGCTASTGADNTEANVSIAEWDALLKGAAETKAAASVGAMVGARGCASYDAASELPSATGAVMAGTGVYTVTVAWQGTSETAAPTALNNVTGVPELLNCANGLYGPETRRRAVSTTFRLARLN